MSDHRLGLDLITDIPDVLHWHGLASGDDRHAGRVIVLTGDMPRICQGSQDHPCGSPIAQARYLPAPLESPSPEPGLGPPAPEDDLDAVTLTHGQVRTVLTTLAIAAERKRDSAEMCTACADQPCVACREAD